MEIADYMKNNADRIAGRCLLVVAALVAILTVVTAFALLSATVTMFVSNEKWFVPASQAILILVGGLLIFALVMAVFHRLQLAASQQKLQQWGLDGVFADNKRIIDLLKNMQPMDVHIVGDVRIHSETARSGELSKTTTVLTNGPFDSTGASAPNAGQGEVGAASDNKSAFESMIVNYHRAILKRAGEERISLVNAMGYGNCNCGDADCPIDAARRAAGVYTERPAVSAPQAPVAQHASYAVSQTAEAPPPAPRPTPLPDFDPAPSIAPGFDAAPAPEYAPERPRPPEEEIL